MTTAGNAIGRRVKIVDVLHSPARTRAYASWLLGQRGTVVGILLNGTLALVELDGEPSELLGCARRWPIHWDDLLVYSVDAGPVNVQDGYRLGLSGLERGAVQHAVHGGSGTSLCGEPVHPLPICGWSLRFSPGAARACPVCVRWAVEAS